MGRHGGAEARVALTGAVAVKGDRLFLGQQGLHGFGELVRAGDAGVAQRVVEHVLIADLAARCLPYMKVSRMTLLWPSMAR